MAVFVRDSWMVGILPRCFSRDMGIRDRGWAIANGLQVGWRDARGALKNRKAKCRCLGARSWRRVAEVGVAVFHRRNGPGTAPKTPRGKGEAVQHHSKIVGGKLA